MFENVIWLVNRDLKGYLVMIKFKSNVQKRQNVILNDRIIIFKKAKNFKSQK